MTVEALDHVNIVTADLEGTAAFYMSLLELEDRGAPPPLTPATVRWMYDRDGRAILHLNSMDAPRAYPRDVSPGPTGSVHHVALRCAGYAAMISRLVARGHDHRINLIDSVGLRQIFLTDPNGVLLELNFLGE